MKVGDRLYCHSFLNLKYLSIGKFYVIDNIVKFNYFEVRNDIGLKYILNYGNNINLYYYKKFFYTLKELRKVKLDKLR